MIGRIKGTLIEKEPPLAVIDVGGLGYEVEVPVSTFADLPPVGQPVTLRTHFLVRDDGQFLYGFLREGERATFRALLKISGIGAKLALSILSGVAPDDLARMVTERDITGLTRLPGIGKKTAERLIIELTDRLDGIGGSSLPGAPTLGAKAEAVGALVALGYKNNEAVQMVRSIKDEDADAETLIRLALKAQLKK